MRLIPPPELPYGKLEFEEVYFQHDGPRFFALKSSRFDMKLLGFCVDEDEERGTVTYIYLVLSSTRFRTVRSGGMSLVDAFKSAESGDIWEVIADYNAVPPQNHVRQINEVPEEWLPANDAFLRLPTPTVDTFNSGQLVVESHEMFRSLMALELDPDQTNVTEIPLRSLGRVSNYLQDAMEALAQEEQGQRSTFGAIAGTILAEIQMSAMEIRAASFVLVVGIDRGWRTLEYPEVVAGTMSRLITIFEAATSEETLLAQLREYGPRVRNRIRHLLQCAKDIDSGLTFYTAPFEGEPGKATLNRRQVSEALNTIAQVQPSITSLPLERVALTALNTTRHTFEVRDPLLGRRYFGVIPLDVRAQANGLPVGDASFYSVMLRVETDFASTEEEPIEKYQLLEIRPITN